MVRSLRSLKELRAEIDVVTVEIESLPKRRDIDIASNFEGDSARVADMNRIVGDKSKDNGDNFKNLLLC